MHDVGGGVFESCLKKWNIFQEQENKEREAYKEQTRANTDSTMDKIHGDGMREAFVANYEERSDYVTGSKLLLRQFRFLLWKRYLNWKRTIVKTFVQLLLPCAFFALALYMTTVKFEREIVFKPVTFSRDQHLDARDILATYRNSDGVADTVVHKCGLNTEHRLQRLSATNCLANVIVQRRSRMLLSLR